MDTRVKTGLGLSYAGAHRLKYYVEERLKYMRGAIVTIEIKMKEGHQSAGLNAYKHEKSELEKLEKKIKNYINERQ